MMRSLVILATLATAFILVAGSESDDDDDEVVDLSGVDFSPWLKKQPVAVVFFYSPKNAKCRKLLEEFDEIAGGIKGSDPSVAVAKIDCTKSDSKKVCLPYYKGGFPAITVFNEGHPWSRELHTENYDVRSEDLYNEAKWEQEGRGSSDSESADIVALVRKTFTEVGALLAERDAEKNAFGSTGNQKPNDASAVVDATGIDFTKWLKKHPIALVMFYSPHSADCRKLWSTYGWLAASFKAAKLNAVLARIDCTESKAKKICDQYVDAGFPTFIVFTDGRPWQHDPENDKAIIEETWKDLSLEADSKEDSLLDSELAAPLRTGAAKLLSAVSDTQSNRAGPEKTSEVVDLSGVDFAAWLKKQPKALVMFYSPRSYHCRKLMTFFEGISGAIKVVKPEAVFAKVDCTEREMKETCKQYVDSGFPTIMAFSNGFKWHNNKEKNETAEAELLKFFSIKAENFEYMAKAQFTAPLREGLFHLLTIPAEGLSANQRSEGDSDVVALPGVEFASWLKSHPVALVMFHSAESDESRKVLPEFDAFIKEANEDAVAAFAKIDCKAADSQEICLTYVEDDFPTLTVFRDGRPWSTGENNMDRKVGDALSKPHLDGFSEPLRKAFIDLNFLLGQIKLEKEMGTKKQPPIRVDDLKGSSPVDDLTDVDFSAWLSGHPVALIMFYSSKRTNFRQVLQQYDFNSAFLKQKYPFTTFGKVDCTREISNICGQYAASSFPSYVVFKDGLIYKNDNQVFASLVETMFKNGVVDPDSVKLLAPMKKAIALLIGIKIEMEHGKDAMRWAEEL